MNVYIKEEPGQITEFSITPHTPSEAVELNQTYRWFNLVEQPLEYADFLSNPCAKVVSMGPRSIQQGAGYVVVEADIVQAMDPYVQLLQRRTGFCLEDHELEIDLLGALGECKATRLLLEATYHPGRLSLVALVAAYGDFEEHDDIARTEKATKWLLSGLNDDLGRHNTPSEFIQRGNGMYTLNPDYPHKKLQPTRCVGHEKVWLTLWQYWEENHASAAQLAALGRFSTFKNGPTKPTARDFQGFHVDNYEAYVTWEDFSAL